jgi:hypothetical protein
MALVVESLVIVKAVSQFPVSLDGGPGHLWRPNELVPKIACLRTGLIVCRITLSHPTQARQSRSGARFDRLFGQPERERQVSAFDDDSQESLVSEIGKEQVNNIGYP